MRARLESAVLRPDLAQRFDAGEKALNEVLNGLREPLGTLAQTLTGALDTVSGKMVGLKIGDFSRRGSPAKPKIKAPKDAISDLEDYLRAK